MEGRELVRSSSSRRRFLWPEVGGGEGVDYKLLSYPPRTSPPPPASPSITPLYLLVGMGRGWDRFTSPGRGASGGGGVPGGVPGVRYRSSRELLR